MELWNQLHGAFLTGSVSTAAVLLSIAAILALGYTGAGLLLWTVFLAIILIGFGVPTWLLGSAAAIAFVFNVRPLRKGLVSSAVMKAMKALELLPSISPTERTALEAGVVWREADLFSGKPDFGKLIKEPYPKLTDEEQSFLDNEVEEFCAMIDDWEFFKTKQMSEEAFEFMKKKGLLGMIIPKEYGGLGFSHAAHSAILQKIASHSVAATIYIMVPNSLGPAELLNHYGTKSQKDKLLPRLADGREVPCFGLTEPTAGSDAGAIRSQGELFKGKDGEIYIRLNWKKRWITLASISTVLGLAFQLRDPENLLGKGENVGITCALIPANLPGIELGKRHDPLGIPFHNCPMEGHNVEVKADEVIIGGIEKAGEGWQMLMESLGAGRGISLPAQATGGAKMVTRVASSHAMIRKQFGLPIGKFEGVREPLSRIASDTYALEAMRNYILSALDQGISPPVCTAMAKYNATEMGRRMINDGMDVLGGAGISMGKRNKLATTYIGTPIGITVEGANILTRTLMVFGQGALRAHPYAFKEVDAVENNDVDAFDRAFWGHIKHVVRNKHRSLLLSATRGYLASSPVGGPVKRYYQKLAWSSASFAILADLSMGLLGGKLKVKEQITGRFADILSNMFIGTAILTRWEAEGRKKDDLPLVHHSMTVLFSKIQASFDGIYANMDVPFIGWIFKGPVRWWSQLNPIAKEPSDRLTNEVAKAMMENLEVRDRLSQGIYMPKDPESAMGRLEAAFQAIKKAEPVEKKLKKAMRKKELPKAPLDLILDEAFEKKLISKDEYELIKEAEEKRMDAIQVDDFTDEEYLPGATPGHSFRSSSEGNPYGAHAGGAIAKK